MREILFRGKSIDIYADDGRFLYGDLFHNGIPDDSIRIGVINFSDRNQKSDNGIEGYEYYKVDPDTIGEYTGLKDKNGKNSFEGDICIDDLSRKFVITFKYNSFWAEYHYKTGEIEGTYLYEICGAIEHFEIIGNVHENPELLKEKEK